MLKAINEIRKSKFLIVNLTQMRPSVFFEAGFAYGLGLDIIYVYKESRNKHLEEFYVNHFQCHKYSTPEQLKEIVSDAIGEKDKVPQK